jgi:hypothetical protein
MCHTVNDNTLFLYFLVGRGSNTVFMDILYSTLGTRFNRLLVENITIGYIYQQPSFSLSFIKASHTAATP